MTPEEVREWLRQWGHAQVHRYCYSRGDRSIHVLEQVRDLAPGTTERALRNLIGRNGRDRRRMMASAAGVKSMDIVPMWACDPVPASNDACRPFEHAEVAFDQGIPDHLRWVDREVVALGRQYPLRGLVVRTEYTESASQAVKAHMVEDTYGGKLTLRQYRLELEKSWDWFAARAAA